MKPKIQVKGTLPLVADFLGADERRNQKAKKIKEEASMEELKTESEEKENGK